MRIFNDFENNNIEQVMINAKNNNWIAKRWVSMRRYLPCGGLKKGWYPTVFLMSRYLGSTVRTSIY